APGGSAEVSMALSDNYLKQVRAYETEVETLLKFLYDKFPKDDSFHKIKPMPQPETPPQVWMLGTSEKSAALAARKGLAYCFGDFMTDANGPKIAHTYRQTFQKRLNHYPELIVAVNVVCAETDEAAHELANSQIVWKLKQERFLKAEKLPSIQQAYNYHMSSQEAEKATRMKKNMLIGSPETVARK